MVTKKSVWSRLAPPHIIALMFLTVIFIGTFLLLLPVSRKMPLSFIDAIFTSTSATCVTGLMTVNAAETFTFFGQVVLLLLIQIGGMGITFVSSFFMIMLGRSMSIRGSSMVHESFSSSVRIDLNKLVYSILVLVLVFETFGTVTLAWYLWDQFPPLTAIWMGLFHSISAFFNAGISILPSGLDSLPKNPIQDIIFTILIWGGALGFMTYREFYERVKYPSLARRNWTLQTKIVLTYTAILTFLGALGIYLFERNGVLANLPFIEQVTSSIFHSVSARTAGFSNIDFFYLNNSTLYLFMLLMFIGGGPGSAAGGIKVTTFAVLIGLAISRYKGHEASHIFNRAIPEEIVSRSISIVFLSVIVMTLFLFFLLVSEAHLVDPHTGGRASFMEILFEAVSAHGTVGLSMGITSKLSTTGKVLITLMMFIGRLGPLAIAVLVGTREKGKAAFKLSEESVMVG